MENAKKFCVVNGTSGGSGSNGVGPSESKINQAHGFAFGEGNDFTKAATYTKSAASHIGVGGGGGHPNDNPNLKLTSHISSSSSSSSTAAATAFDIKVKRKRACQMKMLVVLLAMMSAACIGCILAFFYMRYQHENELHFNYTQNMVIERACNLSNSF